MLKSLIFIFIISLIFSKNERKTFKELVDIYLNKLDINNAYLSYDQYISVIKSLKNDFPNYLDLSSIGKSYEGNEMFLITIKSPFLNNEEISISKSNLTNISFTYLYTINNNTHNDNNNYLKNITNNTNETNILNNPLYNKSGIFFNGLHHGREPVSMMMNIYLILYLLSLPKAYLHLFLSSTNIYFLPIINIDGYIYNCKKYFVMNSTSFKASRKNRRPFKNINCSDENIGIDLNRNYDYLFGKNDIGSSGSPCNELYRGEYPFSEPETFNIKNFVDSHPDIKIVFNYHSWGNLIIIPFSHLEYNDSENLLQKNYSLHYKMYQDFKKEANFPNNFLFGNSQSIINYKGNGEASDWLLGKKKILSFSIELGNRKGNSENFFPDRNATFDIIEDNLYSALYGIQKSMFFLKSKLLKAEYFSCLYKNRYNDIYFNNKRLFFENNNLKDIELRNCLPDEIVLNAKIEVTNHGFGTYYPGIEFNYNNQNSINNNHSDIDNKKYFYFLALDLKVELNNVKSICYWSNFENDTNSNNNTIKSNDLNSNNNNTKNEELNIKCSNNKDNEFNDMKLFIDNEIKSMESIIINIQIIAKRHSFIEKKKYLNRKLDQRLLDINITNINKSNISIIKINETDDLIKLYTKRERKIK